MKSTKNKISVSQIKGLLSWLEGLFISNTTPKKTLWGNPTDVESDAVPIELDEDTMEFKDGKLASKPTPKMEFDSSDTITWTGDGTEESPKKANIKDLEDGKTYGIKDGEFEEIPTSDSNLPSEGKKGDSFIKKSNNGSDGEWISTLDHLVNKYNNPTVEKDSNDLCDLSEVKSFPSTISGTDSIGAYIDVNPHISSGVGQFDILDSNYTNREDPVVLYWWGGIKSGNSFFFRIHYEDGDNQSSDIPTGSNDFNFMSSIPGKKIDYIRFQGTSSTVCRFYNISIFEVSKGIEIKQNNKVNHFINIAPWLNLFMTQSSWNHYTFPFVVDSIYNGLFIMTNCKNGLLEITTSVKWNLAYPVKIMVSFATNSSNNVDPLKNTAFSNVRIEDGIKVMADNNGYVSIYIPNLFPRFSGANTEIRNARLSLTSNEIKNNGNKISKKILTAMNMPEEWLPEYDSLNIIPKNHDSDFNNSIILKSPDDTKWELKVDNNGEIKSTSV